jgi:hypothetical protein
MKGSVRVGVHHTSVLEKIRGITVSWKAGMMDIEYKLQ